MIDAFVNNPIIQQRGNFRTNENDPLHVVGSQELIDSGVDPIGALRSPYGGFPQNQGEINALRMQAKTRDSFGLASEGDPEGVEIARSTKLKKLG